MPQQPVDCGSPLPLLAPASLLARVNSLSLTTRSQECRSRLRASQRQQAAAFR
ncbi:MAG: hypothetical protein NTW21_37635 [Verrucomicrobia bacterium]|nr:hypothetical protein [Verrucomicrobiota bacterium]